MNYCLYHANCMDGFAAAWVVWNKYGDSGWKYIPVKYQEPVPAEVINDAAVDKIIIVDFSYNKTILEELEKHCQGLIVIDHHDTAPQEYVNMIFDSGHSGCMLTWNFFNVNAASGYVNEPPEWLLYVEDRDLWKWQLPESKEVSLGLETVKREFREFNFIDLNEIKNIGNVIKEYKQGILEKHSSFEGEIWGYRGVRFCEAHPMFTSDLGEMLKERYPEMPFSVIYGVGENTLFVSLRQGCSDVHLGSICQQFGGGGHKNAAGFKRTIGNVLMDLIPK